jgi:hypothetical protein
MERFPASHATIFAGQKALAETRDFCRKKKPNMAPLNSVFPSARLSCVSLRVPAASHCDGRSSTPHVSHPYKGVSETRRRSLGAVFEPARRILSIGRGAPGRCGLHKRAVIDVSASCDVFGSMLRTSLRSQGGSQSCAVTRCHHGVVLETEKIVGGSTMWPDSTR